ncbi:MAG: AtpZ/AtpI family protein [Candidatus Kapaibacterium sp.]
MSQQYKRRETRKLTKEIGPYVNLGLQLAITVGLFVYIGYWLDGKWDTEPAMIITFSMLGIAVGMFTFIRTVLNANKKKPGRKDKK